jgi:hypothetical protein
LLRDEEIIEYRYVLELLKSPFELPLNPTPLYDHSSVYIYRIIPKPVVVSVTFEATGSSYVEVYDADNKRFLLAEKTAITGTATFDVNWDGKGVFEPRVWKNSNVTKITIAFTLPEDEKIVAVKAPIRTDKLLLALGSCALAGGLIYRWRKAR